MKDDVSLSVSVDAHGTALADHDRVQFSVTAEAVGNTASAAKAQLLKLTTNYQQTLDQVRTLKGVMLDELTLTSNSSISKHFEYDRKAQVNVPKGFKAAYQASFQSMTPGEASAIYDCLTDQLSDFNVSNPVFSLKHQEQLRLQALEDAQGRVMNRFKAECRVMGKDPDDYSIATWNVNYGNHGGRAALSAYSNYADDGVIAAGASASPQIEIHASKAIVTVYLTVTFVPKKKGKK